MEFPRSRPWWAEVMVQALGTAIGAGIAFVFAKVVGLFDEVPWATVGKVAAGTVGLMALVAFREWGVSWLARRQVAGFDKVAEMLGVGKRLNEAEMWKKLTPEQKQGVESALRTLYRTLGPF